MAQDTAETISATITVTNSEACLISAMLTSGDKDTIATITDKLDPADFANTLLARIFATLQELVNDSRPTDASTVLNTLQAKGNRDGLADDQHHIMTELVTLKIVDLHLADYARQVASTSYRRQYLHMTEQLRHAAEHAPEAELLDIMINHGIGQRKAWQRYQDITTLKPSRVCTPRRYDQKRPRSFNRKEACRHGLIHPRRLHSRRPPGLDDPRPQRR